MDNPMDPGFLNIPARADTSATSDPSSMTDPDLIKGIDDKKRIAQLEHEIFTVCKQLDERSEKLKETQQQNAVLKERVVSLEQEKVEKAQFVESLVQSRDNLIFEKTQLQNDKLSLERRKDEIEVQISKLTNDKRRHLDEIEQLKKQCDADQADKIELQMQLDDFRSEKAALAYEKEQWNREKEILLMSKQWYMNEISNREQQINELRIQAIRDKSGMQREITLLNERNNELAYSNEQFTKQLAEREKELAEVQEKFRQVMDENTARIGELETELRTWERLSNVYKEASQAAEKEIEELRESEARLEALLKDKEEVIQEIALELEQSKEKHAAEIKAKDQEIKRLSDEITKSTELLNAGFRLNRPDEEISRLSPAAAAASSLLKSGMSLTAIYAEHCRVVSELERKNAEYNQMERYVKEVIQDLDSKAPQFREQRKTYDKMCERNECLRLQNELLSKERQKFQSQADSLHREMAFIKRELERYQREHQLLRMQNKRLLYVAEKGAAALDHSHMNGDSIQDQYLYSSIDELQARNLELAEELERLRDEQDKIIENYHNTEIETLKQARNLAEEQLSRLNENYAKQELMIREISEQRDQYKNLYDQLVQANNAGLSPNASTASDATQSMQRPQSVGSMQADLILWRTKAERLQETLAYLTDDRQTHERILNDRIDQQLEQISTMRNTIGKLQSDVEFQNKNQQLLAKQTDSYALDLKKSQDQLSEAKRQVETLQFKCDSLVSQLLERQQELSMLKVQNHSQSEQLQISTSREQRMHAELGILRSSQYNSERISTTLQGMESLLKRVDTEKAHSIENQLQSALLERDSLRQLVENLNEQHNQLVMGLKTTLNETCSERDRAQFDCKSVQSRLDAVERLYEQLKKENEKLQSEMEQIQSTDTNVEACKKEMHQMKNTIAYHEKQLAEYEHKCEELNSTIERKDKQLEEICRLGTDMEGTIQFGTLERQRMQAVREQLEHDVQSSKSLIEELRNNLAAKEMELLNQAKELSAVNHQLQEFQSQHDQQLMEKEGMLHQANLLVEQLQGENQGLKTDSETLTAKCGQMSETNLRLASDLAKEIATTEKLTQEIAQLKSEHASRRDSLQRSIDALQQEKFRLQDELKAYAARDEEHVKKHDSLYDEIQKLLKQIEFMERLQNTISSPSPNVSLNTSMMNVSSMTAATFSPGTSRLSLGGTADTSSIVGGQQQHTDRINTIIGYMRTEKQKETELRMNAELELQRIRAQAGMDQQKIFDLEAQMVKLRNEAEANANAAVEKEQLLTRLNALNDVQARYQQLKKTFDELSQQYTQLGSRTQELDGQLLKLQAEKKNLETRLESATKLAEDRAQQNKGLRERCERAMAMASKYSPDIVNSLQGENEKLKSEAVQRDSELALLRKECGRLSEELAKLKNEHTALTEKHNALVEKRGVENTQLATVKQLARKLRDEKTAALADNVKIQSELKSVQDELARLREAASAAAAAATASPTPAAAAATPTLATTPTTIAQARKLQEQVAALTREKEELTAKVAALVPLESERDQLKAQLERMQRELDDSAEKVMRVDMVEKAYGNSQQRIGSLSAEVRQLQEENQRQRSTIEELEQQLNLLQQNIRERERQAAESAALADVPAPHTPVTFNFAEQNPPNNPFANQQQQQKEEEQSAEKQQDSNAQQHHFGHQETPASPLQPQSPTSPPPTFPDQLQQEQLQQEQAILDELTKEDAENPNVGVGDELGEALLDIEETEDPQQLQLEEEEFIQKPQQQPIGEIDQPAADEEYRSEEDFGDKVPNESEGAGMGGAEEEMEEEDNEDEEDFEEEGEEPIGISDEDEEGEEAEGGEAADESGLMDESGDFSYEGGGEGEEGGEADSSFEMGEPPRKQRRMHPGGGGGQQQQGEEEEEGMEGGEQQQGSNMESTSAQPPAADDDDDDDIQLL